jgi:hypothetical protein
MRLHAAASNSSRKYWIEYFNVQLAQGNFAWIHPTIEQSTGEPSRTTQETKPDAAGP